VETVFFAANVIKVTHGAWLPLAVGLLISAFMVTWRRGQVIVTRNRQAQEGSLELFLARLAQARPPISRSPGTGIFLSPSQEMTPLALRAQVEHNQVLQEKIVLVTLEPVSVPRVGAEDRFAVQALGQGRMKVLHVTIHVGYRDGSDVPAQLALARKRGLLERNLDLEGASYFLSRISIVPGAEATMRRWRKRLFITMARNCASPIEHFALPPERTVEMGSQVTL
jgi:KUP system potassium uptake protein